MHMFSSLLSEQDKPCYYGQFSQLKHCWCGERSNKHEYFVLSNKFLFPKLYVYTGMHRKFPSLTSRAIPPIKVFKCPVSNTALFNLRDEENSLLQHT